MKYPAQIKPADPGFYWVMEKGSEPRLVEVCIESDSHCMYYVLLPDDDNKYSFDAWPHALWFGPVPVSHNN